MSGHYPSEQVLKIIREYDIENDSIKELLDLLSGEWEYADQGGFRLNIRGSKVYLQLNTLGWSGNEDLINAFEKIKYIGLFWQKSERGGHYYYQFPKLIYEKGIREAAR